MQPRLDLPYSESNWDYRGRANTISDRWNTSEQFHTTTDINCELLFRLYSVLVDRQTASSFATVANAVSENHATTFQHYSASKVTLSGTIVNFG